MLLPEKTQHTAADAAEDAGAAVADGWTVHVEIQLEGHPPDEVTQAAAAALVEELTPWTAAAFGGRGMVTLVATQPPGDAATAADPSAGARALEAALAVVSRFGQVRRVQQAGEPTVATPPQGSGPRRRGLARWFAR